MTDPALSEKRRKAMRIRNGLHDTREVTRKATENNRGNLGYWLKQIPEDLPQAERERRAESFRLAYMHDLTAKSIEARRKRSKQRPARTAGETPESPQGGRDGEAA